jgi:hypothetical protein
LPECVPATDACEPCLKLLIAQTPVRPYAQVRARGKLPLAVVVVLCCAVLCCHRCLVRTSHPTGQPAETYVLCSAGDSGAMQIGTMPCFQTQSSSSAVTGPGGRGPRSLVWSGGALAGTWLTCCCMHNRPARNTRHDVDESSSTGAWLGRRDSSSAMHLQDVCQHDNWLFINCTS